jgi:hypothetical protein
VPATRTPLISIQDGTLTIRRYYFPTRAKRIRLKAITGVEEYAMTKGTGKLRIWGRATSSMGQASDRKPVAVFGGPCGREGRTSSAEHTSFLAP